MGIEGFKFHRCMCGGLLVSDYDTSGGRYVKRRTFCGSCGKTPGQALDRRQLAAGEQFDEPEHYE